MALILAHQLQEQYKKAGARDVHFHHIALTGLGHIGAFIAEELLKQKAAGKVKRLVILSRSTSDKTKGLEQKGAEVKIVDFSSKESLTEALSGIDVVISAVSALDAQAALAVAAKDAGVKLFVPSEFGSESDIAGKRQAREQLKELDLPYALFSTGLFSDMAFAAWTGIDPVGGKATVGGDGNAPISFTSRADVARYVAHVLLEMPAEKLKWRTFRIEGERVSFNDIFQQCAAKTGKKVDVSYISIADLEEAVGKNPADFKSTLLLHFAQGNGVVGKKEELANGEIPGWNPKSVVEVLLG